MTIFEKIDLIREGQRMKASELCRQAKISRTYWHKLKATQGKGISYDIAERLLLVLGRKLVTIDVNNL